MAFTRPTLAELVERIQKDLESRLTNSSPVLRRSFISVIARVIAGASHILFGYLDFVSKQLFPDTAESANLDRWATIWGVPRKAADFAQGNVTFTGTNGSVIPGGTEIQRSDGLLFTTDAPATISAGTATVAVTAAEAGVNGNTDAGVAVSLISPIAGVDTNATVAVGGLIDGQDPESDELLRDRVLQRIRNPPLGGSMSDFEKWALEVSGVTRAWVTAEPMGLGTVGVSFVLDAQTPSIIPGAPKIAEVQAYIDERRPVTIEAFVSAPATEALNFTIDLTPDTAPVRAAVEAELKDLIKRTTQPGGTIKISHIREAISIAAGETDHVLSAPAGNVTADPGEIFIFGAITWL